MKYNPIDYSSFYNVRVKRISKFKRIKRLTYEYKDFETGYFIEEEEFISSDNKLFFHFYDAVLHEYKIDLSNQPFEYI
jgi:hypothetical protein